jgi:hypothetical protein
VRATKNGGAKRESVIEGVARIRNSELIADEELMDAQATQNDIR